MSDDAVELYRKWRPTRFKDVIGQNEAICSLLAMLKSGKVPHAILFSGQSGCAKTTLARILRKRLGCHDYDFAEVNVAESRGIDSAREIQQRMGLSPLGGACKVWLLDEAHRGTTDWASAMLKVLEDTPSHVYFLLATTDPDKLLPTIRTRCTEIKVKLLDEESMRLVLARVIEGESISITDVVLERIIEVAAGSARKALVLLHQVMGLDEEAQLSTISGSDTHKQAIDLVKLLLWGKKTKWADIVAVLDSVEDEPEGLRRMVMAIAAKEVKKGKDSAQRAFAVMQAFFDPLFDCPKEKLIYACWSLFTRD